MTWKKDSVYPDISTPSIKQPVEHPEHIPLFNISAKQYEDINSPIIHILRELTGRKNLMLR